MLQSFHRFEERFAPQAGVWVLLAGASGFWMVHRANLWDRFADPQYWRMHAMVLVWLAFALMLFTDVTGASLGHTGRPLVANGATVGVFVLVTAGAVLRVAAAYALILFRPRPGNPSA